MKKLCWKNIKTEVITLVIYLFIFLTLISQKKDGLPVYLKGKYGTPMTR